MFHESYGKSGEVKDEERSKKGDEMEMQQTDEFAILAFPHCIH